MSTAPLIFYGFLWQPLIFIRSYNLQALTLFKISLSEGHFLQQQWEEQNPPSRAEINLHAMTAGVAMLSLFCWLMRLRFLVKMKENISLPVRLAIVTDKGKGSKEQGNLVVKEAVAAIMALWQAPFRFALSPFLAQPDNLNQLSCNELVYS